MKNTTYEKVFETIVNEMEKGNATWVKDWNSSFGLPRNATTGSFYRGGNVLALMACGNETCGWLTFRQAMENGCCVRKGEKGASVFFMSKTSPKEGEAKESHFFAKHYTVFNIDQLEEQKEGALQKLKDKVGEKSKNDFERLEDVEKLVNASGAQIIFGSPSYSFTTDTVRMPDLNSFNSREAYYATSFHELIHWTGNASRLNRPKNSKFGSEDYAFEELVAELGAAFLCARFEIGGVSQSGAYLKHWAKACRQHSDMLPKAASLAQKAVDFLLSKLEVAENTTEKESENLVATV